MKRTQKMSLLKTTVLIVAMGMINACSTTSSSSMSEDQNQEFFNEDMEQETTVINQTPSGNTTDNILLIVDSSSSLKGNYFGIEESSANISTSTITKFSLEKQLIGRINTVISNEGVLTSGLRNFGFGKCLDWKHSELLLPMQPHLSISLSQAANQLECASGGSPAHRALQEASSDLNLSEGNSAILFLSDGNFTPTPAIHAIRQLKKQLGDQLCVYPIWVGNGDDIDGYRHLRKLNAGSCCGFTVKAEELQDDEGLQVYLNTVLNDFGSPADTDCDGIPNRLPDQCPSTPLDTPVDALGCALDDDKDGVVNALDYCPNTPFTAPVDSEGCWQVKPVRFATNQSNIEYQYHSGLNETISVMKYNPELSIAISGNTDNISSFGYNAILSQKRADVVKEYFINQGITAKRMKTRAYSFSKPIESNETSQGREKNRRTEFKIMLH